MRLEHLSIMKNGFRKLPGVKLGPESRLYVQDNPLPVSELRRLLSLGEEQGLYPGSRQHLLSLLYKESGKEEDLLPLVRYHGEERVIFYSAVMDHHELREFMKARNLELYQPPLKTSLRAFGIRGVTRVASADWMPYPSTDGISLRVESNNEDFLEYRSGVVFKVPEGLEP